MAKMPIDWHINNLKNSEEHYAREMEILELAKIRLAHLMADNNFCRLQIVWAKAEGKDGFDAEKYKPKK